MVWDAVAAIGGSLISGIFGSRKRKEETITDQTSTSTIDYKALADAAIDGGFNPLTAIRTGGASGFVTTRTTGKNVTTSSGGGAMGAAIGDAIASAGSLFGSFNTPKNDPIRVKSKDTGAVRSLVASQLRGGTRAAPAVNVQPTIRVQTSPRTILSQVEMLNKQRMHTGSFVGPRFPRGVGPDGEIEDAMVAFRRSDGSLMHMYNPKMIDGDAAAAAAATDALNRANDIRTRVNFPRPEPPKLQRSGRVYRVPGKFSRGNAAF